MVSQRHEPAMESGDNGDGIYDGDGADDQLSVDINIEVVKDALMDILNSIKGVPTFRAIMATAATTPPLAREPPETGGWGAAQQGQGLPAPHQEQLEAQVRSRLSPQ